MQTFKLRKSWLAAGIFLILILSIAAPAQIVNENDVGGRSEQRNSTAPTENTEDLIHIGDLIDVDIIGSSEFDWRGSLTPEGFLDGINFVDEPIYALCQTKEKIAAEIVRGYEKLLRNPEAAVRIIDRSRRPVSLIYGAVKTPQRFQIKRPVRLNELLILSGGISEKAGGEIQILRSPDLSCSARREPGERSENATDAGGSVSPKPEAGPQYINIKISDLLKGKPESNPLILTGDVVTVIESKPIYVTGGVNNPKQINARAELNVARAVAAAGGLAKNADPKKIIVFRRENAETKTFEINLDEIKSGQADDFMLRAFDIVEVTQKGSAKNRYAPFSVEDEDRKTSSQSLPLRVID